ncbi:hypothetical protein G7046_g4360 [Stylonectria norvegica]|nr:hypothetical protein G7046_g4360 [Stylonectria norvegica]
MAKLLTIFGVTGQQGGALANHILEDEQLSALFKLRGITRDISKPAAVALKSRGVELVEADMNDHSSLIEAVAGSYSVFAMTSFWEKASSEIEIAQGKAIADASVAAGVTQIIYSSLPGGEWMPECFVTKAEVEVYIRTLDIKTMFFMPGWFMQNNLAMMRPQKMEDGTLAVLQPWTPATRLPLIDIKDTGKFVAPALLNPDLYNGKRFTCATAFYSLAEMAETWTKVIGQTVTIKHSQEGEDYSELSAEEGGQLKRAGNSMTEYGYYGPTGQDDLAWTLDQVSGKLGTWEEFVVDNQPWIT